jgi:hypothetical protein
MIDTSNALACATETRRNFLALAAFGAVASAFPVETLASPGSDLTRAIENYRSGEALFNLLYAQGDHADDLADRTYVPPMQVLEDWNQPASSLRESIAALEFVLKDMDGQWVSPLTIPLVRAVLDYLRTIDGGLSQGIDHSARAAA